MLEKQLERIADAMEELVKLQKAQAITTVHVSPTVPEGVEDAVWTRTETGSPEEEVVEEEKPKKKTTKKKTTKKKRATKKKTAPPPEPEEEDDELEDLLDEPTITKDDVMEEMRDLVKNKGADRAREILEEFGGSRISAIARSDYGALYNRLKEVNNE